MTEFRTPYKKIIERCGIDLSTLNSLDKAIETLKEIESNLCWFDKTLWDIYNSKLKSMALISEKTGIALSAISKSIKTTKKEIIKNLC